MHITPQLTVKSIMATDSDKKVGESHYNHFPKIFQQTGKFGFGSHIKNNMQFNLQVYLKNVG